MHAYTRAPTRLGTVGLQWSGVSYQGSEGGRQLLKLETARWWGRNFQALPLDSD